MDRYSVPEDIPQPEFSGKGCVLSFLLTFLMFALIFGLMIGLIYGIKTLFE